MVLDNLLEDEVHPELETYGVTPAVKLATLQKSEKSKIEKIGAKKKNKSEAS